MAFAGVCSRLSRGARATANYVSCTSRGMQPFDGRAVARRTRITPQPLWGISSKIKASRTSQRDYTLGLQPLYQPPISLLVVYAEYTIRTRGAWIDRVKGICSVCSRLVELTLEIFHSSPSTTPNSHIVLPELEAFGLVLVEESSGVDEVSMTWSRHGFRPYQSGIPLQ